MPSERCEPVVMTCVHSRYTVVRACLGLTVRPAKVFYMSSAQSTIQVRNGFMPDIALSCMCTFLSCLGVFVLVPVYLKALHAFIQSDLTSVYK